MTITLHAAPPCGRWRCFDAAGSAQALHDADPFGPEMSPHAPMVWRCHPSESALVLGSRQGGVAVLDESLPVARRRTGGGAVLVGPSSLWIDVAVPRDDHLWSDDVGHAFDWLGQAWCDALAGLGVSATVHHGRLEPGEWGEVVCFASRGAGEVFDVAGAKLVGLSQRRTRAGARFQCSAVLDWDPEPYVRALVPADRRAGARASLADVAAPVGADADVVFAAFCAQLTHR